MRVSLNSISLEKQLNNITQYSLGFLEGAQKGKKIFLDNLGNGVIFALGKYIDLEARSNRLALHHIYEWYQTGSPSARLFNLGYSVSGIGLSLGATFKQSNTVSRNSKEPFYNKARIMEQGIPVTISPKSGGALRFEVSGNEVFTKKSITIQDPGGTETQGSFEAVFDEFMKIYFTQAFLKSSGIFDYIQKPTIYKKNFASGAKIGKIKGVSTGFKWIANAKVEVE